MSSHTKVLCRLHHWACGSRASLLKTSRLLGHEGGLHERAAAPCQSRPTPISPHSMPCSRGICWYRPNSGGGIALGPLPAVPTAHCLGQSAQSKHFTKSCRDDYQAETGSEVELKPHDLVTEEHLKKVLLQDKGQDATLSSWNVVNFTKEGDNYSSMVSSVQVKYTSGGTAGESFYVVKLNPRRGEDSSKEITNALFVKESKFYLGLLPELNSVLSSVGEEPLSFPRCFYSSLEMRKEQLYLEDLRLRGFKMYDRKKGLDVPHANLVLKELARFHSASLLLEAKYRVPVESKHDGIQKDILSITESSKESMITLMESCLNTSAEMLEKVGGYGKAIAWIEGLKLRLETILTDGTYSRNFDVVCHGDCWNNNLLFRYNSEGEPIEMMLLDIQGCYKASPCADLNYLMYTSLTGDTRKPNLQEFMSSYYTAFKKVMDAGKMPMPFSEVELMKEFRDKNQLGGIYAMLILPVVLMDSGDVPDMESANNDYEEITKQIMAKAMTMLDTNPLMKPRFLQTFDEFVETGLIS